MIYFQNFGMVRVFEVILLIFDFQAYRWSSWVSRITGKMKKANKGREGQTKARESTIPKFYHFFMSMGLLGVTNSHVSLFLSFKAKKVKKAALVAKNTKLQTGKLIGSKILSYHLVRCFNVPFVQI